MAVGVIVVLSFFRRPRAFYLERTAQSKCQRTRQTPFWNVTKCLFWCEASKARLNQMTHNPAQLHNTDTFQSRGKELHICCDTNITQQVQKFKMSYSHLHWWSGWSWLGRYGSLRGPLWTTPRRNTPPPPAQWNSQGRKSMTVNIIHYTFKHKETTLENKYQFKFKQMNVQY